RYPDLWPLGPRRRHLRRACPWKGRAGAREVLLRRQRVPLSLGEDDIDEPAVTGGVVGLMGKHVRRGTPGSGRWPAVTRRRRSNWRMVSRCQTLAFSVTVTLPNCGRSTLR